MQPNSRISAPRISSQTMVSPTWMGRSHIRPPGRKSVFQVYSEASIPFEWTPILKEDCDEVGIDFFSAPYDFEAIDMLDQYVQMYKAGSGEIDWIEALERMASKGKPFFVATGASDIGEVQRAVHAILKINQQLVLMQCNTNYTASPDNYDHLHLNVLKTYASMFPDVILGLSDHTHALAPVLGAVTLGARVIERHFTDSNDREGPDHKFAMNPQNWATMVEETRLLERSLGSADKFVAGNEVETAIIQRRCLRAARDIKAGEVLHPRDDRCPAPCHAWRDQAARDRRSDWQAGIGRAPMWERAALDRSGRTKSHDTQLSSAY